MRARGETQGQRATPPPPLPPRRPQGLRDGEARDDPEMAEVGLGPPDLPTWLIGAEPSARELPPWRLARARSCQGFPHPAKTCSSPARPPSIPQMRDLRGG